MAENKIRVGIVGFGTVGCGVAKVLLEQGEAIRKKSGVTLELAKVVDLDITTPRPIELPEGTLSTNLGDILTDDSIDVVAELVGGTTFARELQLKILRSGKNVVTANKALLAEYGTELFGVAREMDKCIAFEASCAGGIPVINAIRTGLVANSIDRIFGILNGTCNYILTSMQSSGEDFPVALKKAQELGYAEADPTLDINGGDSGHKLAILASLCFGYDFKYEDVCCEGIEKISIADIQCGREMGYTIKLLGMAEKLADGKITLQVSPCFVRCEELIAQISGPFNAVSVFGSCVGHTMYFGRGAGMMPTASAVVADIVEIGTGASKRLFDSHCFGSREESKAALADISGIESRFYVRVQAKDEPCVLATMSSALGNNGISISGALQHEVPAVDGHVTVVITTHKTSRMKITDALNKIVDCGAIAKDPVCIQIVEIPEDNV
ncbi:MAG: homoserine dehydrogenase [Phycisphaerae bacterium]|jgi:homoserine dehydrogenase